MGRQLTILWVLVAACVMVGSAHAEDRRDLEGRYIVRYEDGTCLDVSHHPSDACKPVVRERVLSSLLDVTKLLNGMELDSGDVRYRVGGIPKDRLLGVFYIKQAQRLDFAYQPICVEYDGWQYVDGDK